MIIPLGKSGLFFGPGRVARGLYYSIKPLKQIFWAGLRLRKKFLAQALATEVHRQAKTQRAHAGPNLLRSTCWRCYDAK
jgi:hypothetical protein